MRKKPETSEPVAQRRTKARHDPSTLRVVHETLFQQSSQRRAKARHDLVPPQPEIEEEEEESEAASDDDEEESDPGYEEKEEGFRLCIFYFIWNELRRSMNDPMKHLP
jgi:hypothetical protein